VCGKDAIFETRFIDAFLVLFDAIYIYLGSLVHTLKSEHHNKQEMPGQRVANGDDGGRGGDMETCEGFDTVAFPMSKAAGRLSRTTTELSSGDSVAQSAHMLPRTKSGPSLTSNMPNPYIARTNSRGSYSGEASPYAVRKFSEDGKRLKNGILLKVFSGAYLCQANTLDTCNPV